MRRRPSSVSSGGVHPRPAADAGIALSNRRNNDFWRKTTSPDICNHVVASLDLDIAVCGEKRPLNVPKAKWRPNILHLAGPSEHMLTRYLARAIHGANPHNYWLSPLLRSGGALGRDALGDPVRNELSVFPQLDDETRSKAVHLLASRQAKVTAIYQKTRVARACLEALHQYNDGQYFLDVDVHGEPLWTHLCEAPGQIKPNFDHAVISLPYASIPMYMILLTACVNEHGRLVFLAGNAKGLEDIVHEILKHRLPLRLLSVKEIEHTSQQGTGRDHNVVIHPKALDRHTDDALVNIFGPRWRKTLNRIGAPVSEMQITIEQRRAFNTEGSNFIATFERLPDSTPRAVWLRLHEEHHPIQDDRSSAGDNSQVIEALRLAGLDLASKPGGSSADEIGSANNELKEAINKIEAMIEGIQKR